MADKPHKIEIGLPAATDGETLLSLASGVHLFTSDDVNTIRELWDEFATRGEKSWYTFVVARRDDNLLGFACYGRRALTEGTWDLYWLGVAQNAQGQGIGKLLLKETEARVKGKGGRLLIIETAGKPEFEPTRQFYLHAGCELEARIRDFYAPGDDLYIFTVRL
jgi:GNAT superfamily N-acetyltransferase